MQPLRCLWIRGATNRYALSRKRCRGRGLKAGRSEVSGRAAPPHGEVRTAYVSWPGAAGRRAQSNVPCCRQRGEMRQSLLWMGYACIRGARIRDYPRRANPRVIVRVKALGLLRFLVPPPVLGPVCAQCSRAFRTSIGRRATVQRVLVQPRRNSDAHAGSARQLSRRMYGAPWIGKTRRLHGLGERYWLVKSTSLIPFMGTARPNPCR